MEVSRKAELIVKAFEEDHDVNVFVAIVDSLKDVKPIIDGLEVIFRERSPKSSVQRLTINEYILHPWKQPVVFTDDTDTLKDIKAHFINLVDSIVHEQMAANTLNYSQEMLSGILSSEVDEDILGNSFIVDSGEFDHKALAEAAAKFTEMFDKLLTEIKISLESGCPITGAFNKLEVKSEGDEYTLLTLPWDGTKVIYQDGLKAGQAILIFGDGSRSLLIQEPHTKQWLLLKDTNNHVKNYIEGIENASET